jgi:5-methylcytosine-specific restriction endonuclease McrA
MNESFYKSGRWKKKRRHILKRDGYLCQECKKYGRRVAATTVHHVKELELYPELAFDDDNLVSLCDACHNKKHPNKGGNKGERRRF